MCLPQLKKKNVFASIRSAVELVLYVHEFFLSQHVFLTRKKNAVTFKLCQNLH